MTKGNDEISMRICERVLQKFQQKKKIIRKEKKYNIGSKVLQEQRTEKCEFMRIDQFDN